MNKQTLIWLAIAVVALGAVWCILASYPASSGTIDQTQGAATTTLPVPTTSDTTPTPVVTTPTHNPVPGVVTVPATTKIVGPLTLVLSYKKPFNCSVHTLAGPARSGTLYVSDGQARFNFGASSMIDDGTNLYVWKKGATTGTKLSASVSTSGSAAANSGGVDPATDMSYLCVAWSPDMSVFASPYAVSFQ